MKTELIELLKQQSFQEMTESVMRQSIPLIRHYYFYLYGYRYRQQMKSVLDNTTKIMKKKDSSVVTKTLSRDKNQRKQVSINTQKIIISILLSGIDKDILLQMYQDIFSLVLDGNREIQQIKNQHNTILQRIEKLEK